MLAVCSVPSRSEPGGPSVSHILAYIDPGSGSLIIQAAIAAIIAIPILLRSQLSRVARALRHPNDDQPSGRDGAAPRR